MFHETARQNHALHRKLPASDHRPQNLRAIRFAQQPAAGDAIVRQRGFDGRRVIVQRPRERARIGDFNKANFPGDGLAKAADERLIAVQAGQINERWQRSFAVDAQLKFFCHSFGDYP
jgi:hypothetical protein